MPKKISLLLKERYFSEKDYNYILIRILQSILLPSLEQQFRFQLLLQ